MNRSTSDKTSRQTWIVAPRSTLAATLLGSALCWLAFPPVAWGALAWLAPIPWLTLVLQQQLPGKKPYRSLWLAGVVFWLLAVHWIRLPHPLNHLALLVLAGYLGVYLPVFVGLSRVAVHRWGLPLWLVAPVVWTGLDWLRGHLMTGFGMGSLAHTQVEYPAVIQIADLAGEYGVTFLILLVAASLANFSVSIFSSPRSFRTILCLLPGTIALGAAIFYGLCSTPVTVAKPQAVVRIALIQGNTLADWKSDPEKQTQIITEYLQLSHDAVRESLERDGRKVDLVIWPETCFRQTLVTVAEGYEPPEERVPLLYLAVAQTHLAELVNQLGSAVLVGIERIHIFPDEEGQPDYASYNSSVLVDAEGKILGTYDKMHRVPFGEYIPFAEWFPSLYQLTPLTGGIKPGQGPTNLRLGELLLAPNICYETAVPHLIRRQVSHMIDREHTWPAAMVNLTNDAWYWGSSELDQHLACGVFRAVEMRTPLLIAANGGLSAHIDRYGHVLQVTERQKTGFLLVDLQLPGDQAMSPSFYVAHGDWFAWICVLCCLVLAMGGWQSKYYRSGDASHRGY